MKIQCMERRKVYGKYRGIVTNIDDPLGLCRIRVKVPSIYGNEESGWALPCLQFADKNIALQHIPKVGSSVWVEFEGGNLEFPIWTGCFYSQ
jgi:uncharacterized protein involved in type VI secretion and phage assembly